MKKKSPNFLIYKNFKIFYSDAESTLQTLDEIFVNESYRWVSDEKSPLILDVGANIGLSCLYFKSKYPEARIICFEPDPTSFEFLCMNIQMNQLKNVRAIRAAISDHQGFANFYGQVDENHTDARGNSLIESWGMQRHSSQKILVQTFSLRDFLSEKVSLLKLDVEGAEELILQDIKNDMKKIENIYLEFHASDSVREINDLERTLELLRSQNFELNVAPGETGIFPPDVLAWAARNQPSLYHIQAVQRAVKNERKQRITHAVEGQGC
jgi:FkbM family methyltransferase